MYKEKEHKELLELVNKHEMLTFGSQIQLRDEIVRRGLSIPIDKLKMTINGETLRIKDFDYLPDLGFKAEQDDNYFRVSRTIRAVIIDIMAIFFGLVFCIIGLVGLGGILGSLTSGTELGFSSIVAAIIYFGLGILGIKFLNGVKRLLDFVGFELTKSKEGITLKKRFDLKIQELKSESSAIGLERYKDKMILKLDDHDLLDSNVNDVVQKMTIESLYQKLKN